MKKPLKIKLLALLTRIDTLPKQGSELTDAMPSLKEAAAAVVAELAKEPRAAAPAEPSERGLRFAAWCADYFAYAVHRKPDAAMLRKWALCYDALVSKDGHTPEQIAAVWTFARSHDFYRKVVLSPLKLRQLDSAGVRWFDRLALAMENKPDKKPATVQITKAGVPQNPAETQRRRD